MLRRNTRLSILIGVFAIVSIISMFIVFKNLQSHTSDTPDSASGYDIAFISNTAEIDSSISNSECYSGVTQAADTLKKTYKVFYSKTNEGDTTAGTTAVIQKESGKPSVPINPVNNSYSIPATSVYIDTIKNAIAADTRLVICPDKSFEECVYSIQNNYLNTYFMIVDGVPHNITNTDDTMNYNVIALSYDESEAGFLAGYSLVYDGKYSIGFIGMENESYATRYGYGFLQGAEYAAKEKNVTADISINYKYAKDSKTAITFAKNMSKKNISTVAICGDEFLNDVCDELSDTNINIITMNHKTSSKNDFVIGYAGKNISSSVANAIINFYSSAAIDGNTLTFDASNNGIFYEYDESYYNTFNSNNYNDIYSKLANGSVNIISDTTIEPSDLELTKIKIIE